MENKWCPVCGGYHADGCCGYPNGEPHTWCIPADNYAECDICADFNTCQSPNRKDRQRPIAPEPQTENDKKLGRINDRAYEYGWNAAVDKCVLAIDTLLQDTSHAVACSALDDAIAALEAVKK